ncbi:MAG: DUF6247 family protein [Acidimicrobiaceae bacterium]|nr:DUF6247 family protein [Acidimicrobiaceae bacterium]
MVLLAPLDSSIRASCNELTAAVPSSDAITAALGDAYPWVENLPPAERELFAAEFADELAAAASIGDFKAVAQFLHEWKVTAEIYTDPDLLRALSGPIEITHGGRVSRPPG